jgi:acyl carrier protein
MSTSSRTPEGSPHQCPVCGKIAALEPCYSGGDSVCPSCGHLLWLFRDRIGNELGVNLDSIKFESLLRAELSVDSLDLAEVVMELEEATGINIPDDIAEKFRSVRDVIEYLRRRQEEG